VAPLQAEKCFFCLPDLSQLICTYFEDHV
jgi:hypothetical protein